MPTFAEVLARYQGRVYLHTEIKGHTQHLAQRTIDLVRAYDMAAYVTVTSFQTTPLTEVGAYAPEFPTGWLVREVHDAIVTQAHAMGCTQLCPRADVVTPALVQRLHAEGFVVRAWGVANAALMRRVVEAGADGMTVNFPDKLLAYLQGRSRQQPS
jgi:glycerophosphoryl diester phosphodiesterase